MYGNQSTSVFAKAGCAEPHSQSCPRCSPVYSMFPRPTRVGCSIIWVGVRILDYDLCGGNPQKFYCDKQAAGFRIQGLMRTHFSSCFRVYVVHSVSVCVAQPQDRIRRTQSVFLPPNLYLEFAQKHPKCASPRLCAIFAHVRRADQAGAMSVNETRPSKADVIFAVKEGSSPSSATFVFGCVLSSRFYSRLAGVFCFSTTDVVQAPCSQLILVELLVRLFSNIRAGDHLPEQFLRLTIIASDVNVISVAVNLYLQALPPK